MSADKVLDSLAERINELDGIISSDNICSNNSSATDRFANETDTSSFVESMRNANTVRKTESDLKLILNYFMSIGETRQPENIEPKYLDSLLARFFLNVRKQDKTEYEPDTLKSYQSSLCRYLLEKKYSVNILNDTPFQHSRDVLAAKRKELKAQGKGGKSKQAEPLTAEEVSLLYERGLLGTDSPTALVNTIWWNNTLHFGLRSRKEHTDMRWGDVELLQTSTGEDFLQYTERATKTRTGISRHARAFQPKMFAIPGDSRCPVQAYKEYVKRRPSDFNGDPDSAFYLTIKQNSSEVWFARQNMGKNKIGNIMKTMCAAAGITGRKVNHSARKTAVTSLLHSGIAPTQIMQVTGHKNVESINDYSSASLAQQKDMSNILSTLASKEEVGHVNDHVISDEDTEMAAAAAAVEDSLEEIANYETSVINLPLQKIGDIPSVIDLPLNVNTSSSTSSSSTGTYLLTGAHIEGGLTIYRNCEIMNNATVKRRRIRCIAESDSD